MSTGKRLYHYALFYKKPILLGLIFLTIAVFADLSGPFIAKTIIDEHIVEGTIEFQPILLLLALFFGLSVVTAVFRYFMFIQSTNWCKSSYTKTTKRCISTYSNIADSVL